MAGLPRFITQTLPAMPRALATHEPHLDRSNVVDAFGIIAIFIAIVSSLPALLPKSPMLVTLTSAALAWGFAEAFTRYRGMAAPSVVFSVIFAEMALVGAALLIPGAQLRDAIPDLIGLAQARPGALSLACAAAGAAMLVHYRLLRSPIDPALAAGAFTAATMLAARAAIPDLMTYIAHFVAAGCAWLTLLAATAMDVSDPHRETRGSDVAFWLHLAAAVILAYAIFACGGVLKEVTAFLALTIFAVLGVAVNRYLILTVTKLGLVVVLAIAVAYQSAELALVTLIPLAILTYAHAERRRIRRRLIERTLPELALILPPVEDDAS